MFPQLSNDHRFAFFLLLVAMFAALFWWWNRRAKKWLEGRDRAKKSLNTAERLEGEPRRGAAARLRYSEQEFQEMVASALDEVPAEFDREWKNVAVIVSTEWPSVEEREKLELGDEELLLGSYSGLARSEGLHSASVPQVIVIYQPALEMLCGSDKKRIERQIRKTVLHELAHHLGMSHERMRKIGL